MEASAHTHVFPIRTAVGGDFDLLQAVLPSLLSSRYQHGGGSEERPISLFVVSFLPSLVTECWPDLSCWMAEIKTPFWSQTLAIRVVQISFPSCKKKMQFGATSTDALQAIPRYFAALSGCIRCGFYAALQCMLGQNSLITCFFNGTLKRLLPQVNCTRIATAIECVWDHNITKEWNTPIHFGVWSRKSKCKPYDGKTN